MSQGRIHDIKPSRKINESSEVLIRRSAPAVAHQRPYRTRKIHNEGGGRGVWYVALVLIVALFFGLSIFFTGASVTLTPQTMDLSLNERFVAYKKAVSTELTFDFMVVQGRVERAATAATKSQVEDVARGTVRIYNNHSAENQPLVIDTRLVDEKGRVYKTLEKVTVPGQKNNAGALEPGFVDIEVYADIPGEEHNNEGDELVLKIAGFGEAKSPKYETIYAEAVTPFTGGFIGERFVLDETQELAIMSELESELSSKLLDQSFAQAPATSLLPEKLSVLIDKKVSQEVKDNGEIVFVLEGSLFNVLFNKSELERYIIQTSVAGAEQGEIYISNIEDIDISYLDEAAQTVNLEELETLGFQINDTLAIVWIVNEESLAFDLVGQKKKDFQSIITRYDAIESAELVVKPFWRGRFPEANEDIEILNTQKRQ